MPRRPRPMRAVLEHIDHLCETHGQHRACGLWHGPRRRIWAGAFAHRLSHHRRFATLFVAHARTRVRGRRHSRVCTWKFDSVFHRGLAVIESANPLIAPTFSGEHGASPLRFVYSRFFVRIFHVHRRQPFRPRLLRHSGQPRPHATRGKPCAYTIRTRPRAALGRVRPHFTSCTKAMWELCLAR